VPSPRARSARQARDARLRALQRHNRRICTQTTSRSMRSAKIN